MYDWGKLLYLLLKTMSVRKAYNCKKKKEKSTELGMNGKDPQMCMQGYTENYTYYRQKKTVLL